MKTDCSSFIEFLLQVLASSLNEAISTSKMRVQTPDKILNLLAEDSTLLLMEIAEHLSVAKSTVERSMVKLKKEGRLVYVGPKKNGYWQVVE